jgi:general secretion pathway protein N
MSILFRIVLILGILLVIAIYLMPLRMAVARAGIEDSKFSARDISGSVWNGRIDGAQIGSYPLGDLDAGVQFFPLLAGTVKMDLERAAINEQNGLIATIGKKDGALLIENASTKINVGQQLAPLPASTVDVEKLSLSFANGRCQSASGTVRMSLDTNIPGLDLKQGLLGNAICQDGILVLPLKSGSAMETLTLQLAGDGTYSGRLLLTGGNRAWTLLLPTLGFRKVPNGYAITLAGKLANGNFSGQLER